MPRNLRDDYRMYYSGTFITRHNEQEQREVMLVEDVTYTAHGFNPRDIVMIGPTYGLNDGGKIVQLPSRQWTGDQIRPYLPEAGYYALTGGPAYVEFSVQNRSNRKGFESNRAIVDGHPVRLTTSNALGMILKPDFKGKLFQDCCFIKSKMHWRGEEVGTFHDGVLTLDEAFEYLRDHLGKQVELFRTNQGA